jgi:hypothetical protein
VAVFKHQGVWDIAVNGKPWQIKADKLWNPVVSSDDTVLATRMEKNGQYFLVVNGRVFPEAFDLIFEPAISPANDKILLKAMKNGNYLRQILNLDTVL